MIISGGYITGFGLLFRIADVWRGDKEESPMYLLENVENGKFAWVTEDMVNTHCEVIRYLGE
jgi:hypothetical protein